MSNEAIPSFPVLDLSETLRELTRGFGAVSLQSLTPSHRALLEHVFERPLKRGVYTQSMLGREIAQNELLAATPPGDKRPVAQSSGLEIAVSAGERTRLLLKDEEGGAWFHLLLRADFSLTTQPIVALRYFANQGPERVIARFRQTALILDRRIEISRYSHEQPCLYSFRVYEGRLSIAINGILVLDRTADEDAATGFIFDVIGNDGPAVLQVEGAWTCPPAAYPHWTTEKDSSAYTSSLILGSANLGTVELGRRLEALRLLPDSLPVEAIADLIAANRQKDRAYADYVDMLLSERLARKQATGENLPPRPEPLLKVSDVTIKLFANPSDKNLRSVFSRTKIPPATILDDLSFGAYSGDIVGIIGKNGAGKSTFLKALVGAMPISSGRIESVTKPILLRPGAGMVGELTGRQNIYKTGLYMDMTMREIDALIDDVIDFAELRDHIDRPFRYYSDGMRARLIFALATAVPRDILLLDELLSAGDASFQKKAVDRLESFMSRAKLVLVVQHTFDFVLSKCTKCLLLERGKPIYFGDPGIATELYKESL